LKEKDSVSKRDLWVCSLAQSSHLTLQQVAAATLAMFVGSCIASCLWKIGAGEGLTLGIVKTSK
jgi:hypothetical protein